MAGPVVPALAASGTQGLDTCLKLTCCVWPMCQHSECCEEVNEHPVGLESECQDMRFWFGSPDVHGVDHQVEGDGQREAFAAFPGRARCLSGQPTLPASLMEKVALHAIWHRNATMRKSAS